MEAIHRFSQKMVSRVLMASICLVAGVVLYIATSTPKIERVYFPDGTLEIEMEVNSKGEKHGKYRRWYYSGQLMQEGTYSHGDWTRMRTYTIDGKILMDRWENDKYEGFHSFLPRQ